MSTQTARRAAATGAVAAAAVLALAAPAIADAPFAMTARVVDASTDQVAAAVTSELIEAADLVVAETDFDLWTVYVDSFDGMQAVDWANETAIASGAATDVLLLAISVEDQEVALSVDEDAAISDADISDIEAAARSAVRSGDWADASIAAASMLIALSTGSAPTPAPTENGDDGGSGSGAGSGLWVLVALAVIAAVVGLTLALRRRSRGGVTVQAGQVAPVSPWAEVTTAELGTRAGSALVELDNDVRSSANELAFAEAQFGLEATRDFKATLATAQQQLSRAFGIQQQLGDAEDGPDAERRAGLIEILRLCESADAALDSQTEALAQLRALQDKAPELLSELDQRATELGARVPAARNTLDQLGALYPATALATVAKAPDQAEALLASARQSVTEGRSRVQADDRGTAVAFARTAEDALQQVSQLLDMVAHAGETLANATSSLDGAIASLTADVSDAGRLAPGDPALAPVVQRAQAALRTGAAAKAGGDPIAALDELAASEQALDAALASRREQEQVQVRAASQLSSQLIAAEGAVEQANTYIETNRGAVQSSARTQLATATSELSRARTLRQSDVSTALTAARSAQQSALAALRLAQQDVSRWHGTGDRSVGGGYYGRSGGIDAGSLLLGGILNELVRGSSGRSSWGGGSSWSGSSGGRTSSGGWGGSRTRSGNIGGHTMRSSGGSSRRSSSGSRRSSGGGRRR